MNSTKTDSYYSTPLEKGLRILGLFLEEQELSLQKIANQLGSTKTSAYRFVNTLVQLGYLRKNPITKAVSLGTNAFILGNGLVRGFDLFKLVKPFADQACNTYKVTVDSSVYEEGRLFILYRREVGDTLTYRLPNVTTALTSTAVGKAVLAFLPHEEQLEKIKTAPLEPRTHRTMISVEEILCDLHLTKQRGYALNNEEYIPGLLAIAAPLISLNANRVVGAICFDFPTVQHTITEIEEKYADAIIRLGNSISQAIIG